MTFRDSLGSGIQFAALTFLCTGCGAPPTPAGGQPVPAEAPDSMPSTIFEDANFIEESTGDLVSTTILTVGFDARASHADKEPAIRSVSGTVIGGVAAEFEGLYLVRIPRDGTIATIDSIAAEMRSLPGVRSVFKFSWGPLSTGFGAPSAPARGQPVPAEAPDSMPSTIFEDANLIEESTGDLVSTSILSVGFDVTASHAEKESAIRSVSGTVIGGAAGDVEGLYLVRIPGDGTIATIDSIAAEMRSLPGVRSVFKFSFARVGRLFVGDPGPIREPPVPTRAAG